MVRISTDGVNNATDLEGFDRPLPGRYHAVVRSLDDSFSKSDSSLIVILEVLDGTVKDQTGKSVMDFIPVDGKGAKRSLKFALAGGLISESDLRDPTLDIPFSQAVGCDLVIDVEEREYQKDGVTKKTIGVTFLGYHAVGSAAAAGVPLGERPARQNSPPSSQVATSDPVPTDDEYGTL